MMEFAILDYMPVQGRYKAAILNYSEGGAKPLDAQTLYEALTEVSALGWRIVSENADRPDNCVQFYLQRDATDQQAVIRALEAERNAYRAALVEIMHRTLPFEPVLQPGQVRLYVEQYVGWKFGQIARQALAAYPKAKTEDGDK